LIDDDRQQKCNVVRHILGATRAELPFASKIPSVRASVFVEIPARIARTP